MLQFDGRVAVITGAGRGLGREYAKFLAARGARVVVNDFGELDGQKVADIVVEEITEDGGTAVANHDSVASEHGGQAIVDTALERFGRIDILINNAGIVRDRAFHNLAPEQIDEVLDVHLRGAFWVTQPAWKIMRANRYGRIVFTTSLSGLLGNFGQANYGAAKTGIVGLARVLAAEGTNYGITSNVIAPLANTDMANFLTAFDIGDFTASDVAAVVTYLAHEDCALNGEILSAVGGRVARYFIGLTRGWHQPGLGPEDVAAHLDAICSTEGFAEPRTLVDEIDAVFRLKTPTT
ncbi:SDR family NAD(P)-dependent oxidoreductase [Streptomyces sp. NPDC001982]|uniref:SDR family NAD(P)-dependent oxidoreductase n=1 Tax=Streptomyces sp. NPDC001982 TaxID=3154405 RepID=UPI0033289D5B